MAMSSLDIQLAEQDEGIHSDIDYDFFEPDQKLQAAVETRVNDKRDVQRNDSHAVYRLGGGGDDDDEVNILKVTVKKKIKSENHHLHDAHVTCDKHKINTVCTKAVIERNSSLVHEEHVQEVNNGEPIAACDPNKSKLLEINLQTLIGTKSDQTTICSTSESPSCKRQHKEEQVKCFSPPRPLRDNGKYRELMNCIAFQTVEEDSSEDRGLHISSPFTGSLSSDTMSDLTDVTPRSSSSSSSVMKYLRAEHHSETSYPAPSCYTEKSSQKQQATSMKLLSDTVKHLHKFSSSVISNSSSGSGRSLSSRLNMTFTKEEVRKIEQENGLLLKKIQSNWKPLHKPGTAVVPNQPRLSSSAINRRRMQQRIEHDNLILMKKIQNVKVAINTGLMPKSKRR